MKPLPHYCTRAGCRICQAYWEGFNHGLVLGIIGVLILVAAVILWRFFMGT